MKKLVSSLLTKDQFWSIIEKSNHGKNLKDELAKLTQEELLGYKYWWDYLHAESYKQDLWAVAYTVMGGCGDDGFDYFRFWLVTRGQDVYEAALANTDSLCDEFDKIPDGEYPEWEEVSYIHSEVFEEKWGKDIYDAEWDAQNHIEFLPTPRPEIDFKWEEDDEESIKAVCPNTFDKWWGNKKFGFDVEEEMSSFLSEIGINLDDFKKQ
ncbi:MAG: DUF4240 domain-containing protein [Defluviitaleaceae bacterium]|nr:DUF4240 domain-containing protein [Defluviitaleaceae bacterium]